MSASDQPLKQTPLFQLHQRLDARMVPFAGYNMPVQYPAGIKAEHLYCRRQASLFDVSHMGQIQVSGPGATRALEQLLPADLAALKINQQCYSFFTNARGGIIDDLIITRRGEDAYFLVINASRKTEDLAHLRSELPDSLELRELDECALIAIQGPKAAGIVARHWPAAANLRFMHATAVTHQGQELFISRSGYTGEDGFEISAPAELMAAMAEELLQQPDLAPAGLGARDSLRLEAGLCLYGQDLDEQTTPVEAGLAWAIPLSRRKGGAKAGGFCGAEPILQQLNQGPTRKRVGLDIDGRAPVREGAVIIDDQNREIGRVSSGGFGPSVEKPVAMAYIDAVQAKAGTAVAALVRDRPRAARVCRLPFVPLNYFRG